MTAEEYVVSELKQAKGELDALKTAHAALTETLKGERQKLEKLISIIPWKEMETEGGNYIYIESILKDCDVNAFLAIMRRENEIDYT